MQYYVVFECGTRCWTMKELMKCNRRVGTTTFNPTVPQTSLTDTHTDTGTKPHTRRNRDTGIMSTYQRTAALNKGETIRNTDRSELSTESDTKRKTHTHPQIHRETQRQRNSFTNESTSHTTAHRQSRTDKYTHTNKHTQTPITAMEMCERLNPCLQLL